MPCKRSALLVALLRLTGSIVLWPALFAKHNSRDSHDGSKLEQARILQELSVCCRASLPRLKSTRINGVHPCASLSVQEHMHKAHAQSDSEKQVHEMHIQCSQMKVRAQSRGFLRRWLGRLAYVDHRDSPDHCG